MRFGAVAREPAPGITPTVWQSIDDHSDHDSLGIERREMWAYLDARPD
jgi:hypothetical protein